MIDQPSCGNSVHSPLQLESVIHIQIAILFYFELHFQVHLFHNHSWFQHEHVIIDFYTQFIMRFSMLGRPILASNPKHFGI